MTNKYSEDFNVPSIVHEEIEERSTVVAVDQSLLTEVASAIEEISDVNLEEIE